MAKEGHKVVLNVFGIIVAVVAFTLLIISIWLLLVSFAQGCNRKRGTQINYAGGSASGLYWEVKPATRTGSSKFYHGGVQHDALRRDPTSFCEDLVDRWTAAAIIGIITAGLQIIFSVLLIISCSVAGVLTWLPAKTMTVAWALSHIFFVVALIAAFAVGFDGHIHESQEVDVVGPLILGIICLNVFLSCLLPGIGSYIMLKAPPTREHYIYTKQAQHQIQQQQHQHTAI